MPTPRPKIAVQMAGRALSAGFALALACGPRLACGLCQGSLDIGGIGKVFVTGQGATPTGNGLRLDHNNQASITNSCLEHWDPSAFTNFKLLGMTIAFDVDLRNVGCACNLAFYLTQEPALNSAGEPSEGECYDSPYYCDANQICGQLCNELDIMEANSHTFAATPHSCDASSTPEFTSCDGEGRGHNTKDVGPSVYGPGSEFQIDTTQPFQVQSSFYGNPTVPTFTGMDTVLTQGGRSVTIPGQAPPEYMEGMAQAMYRGMALRITYWGDKASTMSWLDSTVCGTQVCDGSNSGTAYITNIRTYPIGQPPSPGSGFGGPSPQERQARRAWSLVLAGAGIVLIALAVHQSQRRVEDMLSGFLGGHSETFSSLMPQAKSKDPEADYEQRSVKLSVFDQVKKTGGKWFEAFIDYVVMFLALVRKYCGYLADICREMSRQRSWNRAAFREALETAGSRQLPFDANFEVGDRVVVKRDFKTSQATLKAGTTGEVQMLMLDAGGGSVVVAFDGHPGDTGLSAEHMGNLQVENYPEVVEKKRKDAKLCVVTTIVVILVLILLHWVLLSGSGSGPAAPAPVIPPGGCCSWNNAMCGSTTEYCKTPQHCNNECLGNWLMPQ